jgi:hypothetical protein
MPGRPREEAREQLRDAWPDRRPWLILVKQATGQATRCIFGMVDRGDNDDPYEEFPERPVLNLSRLKKYIADEWKSHHNPYIEKRYIAWKPKYAMDKANYSLSMYQSTINPNKEAVISNNLFIIGFYLILNNILPQDFLLCTLLVGLLVVGKVVA